VRRASIWLVLAALTAGTRSLFAQGGPPLVTDDPGTPGDGHWEINLATLGSRMSQRWDVDAFDADINYGLGEHVQLKLDAPLTSVRDAGGDWKTGLGMVNAGVKWRFMDEDEHGFALSTYPQYLSAWSAASKRRDIASPDAEFFLPLEISFSAAGFDFAGEAGRNFVVHEPDQWEAGIVAAHACGAALECLVEVHQTWVPHDAQTLLNFGIHWKLSEQLLLLAAAGRDFGSHSDDQQRFVFYLGFQILR
jgi:hypothetical protein